MAYPLGTIQTSYRPLRALVSSVDTDLTASQKKWSYFVSTLHPTSGSSAIAIKLDPRFNQATIIFDHTAEAHTGTFFIYAVREAGSKSPEIAPIERVVTSTLVAGAQETNDSTARYWADTIGTVTSTWPATVSKSDAAAGNGVAKITFDIRGYKYLLCLFTVISAGGIRAWIAYH